MTTIGKTGVPPMMLRIVVALIFIACAVNLSQLSAQAHPAKPISSPAASVPVYMFQLDKDHRMAYSMASPAYEAPVRCSEDGTVFASVFTPPDYGTTTLFALNPHGGTTAYSFEKIGDLYDVAGQNSFSEDATDTSVSFLVYGTRDSATEFPEAGKKPRYTGEHGWYIARFDRDGSYKDSVLIDIPHFEPARIAQFDTGQYLVLGVDTMESVPKLALLDSDGQLRLFFDPKEPLPSNTPSLAPMLSQLDPSAPKEWRHSFQVQQAARVYQLTHHGSAIDLLEPGSQGPIFEVFPGGVVNIIPVRKHPGYDLDSIVPSNGKTLFVRFQPAGTIYVKPGQGVVEEIDPTDGTPLKRISFEGLSLWDILCIHDSVGEILRTGKPSSIFNVYKADLVPAPAKAAQ